MADEPENTDAAEEAAETEETTNQKSGSPLPYIIVGVVGTVLGLCVPLVLPASAETPVEDQAKTEPKKPASEIPDDSVTKVIIPFDPEKPDLVLNLSGDRMTRFLRIEPNFQVAEDHKVEIEQKLKDNHVLLRNWIISHCAEKDLEDIRGKAGQNRMRREIRDHFNSVLFPDGEVRIFDVLFNAFAVQ